MTDTPKYKLIMYTGSTFSQSYSHRCNSIEEGIEYFRRTHLNQWYTGDGSVPEVKPIGRMPPGYPSNYRYYTVFGQHWLRKDRLRLYKVAFQLEPLRTNHRGELY